MYFFPFPVRYYILAYLYYSIPYFTASVCGTYPHSPSSLRTLPYRRRQLEVEKFHISAAALSKPLVPSQPTLHLWKASAVSCRAVHRTLYGPSISSNYDILSLNKPSISEILWTALKNSSLGLRQHKKSQLLGAKALCRP